MSDFLTNVLAHLAEGVKGFREDRADNPDICEAAGIDPDMYQLTLNDKWINPNQHCTSSTCPLTHSHTARWCGSTQQRQCDCHWDYPERGQL